MSATAPVSAVVVAINEFAMHCRLVKCRESVKFVKRKSMNTNPLISVILPVYNGEKYLSKAIESILVQTYTNFELIIINDGSSDNTENIILSYNDTRIKYVKNDKNLKLIKSLNKGINLAKGQYISRMDADDIAIANLFQKQIEAFVKDESVDIVNINTYELSQDGDFYRPFPNKTYLDPQSIKYIELFENHITHPGIMVKAALMKKYLYKDDGTVINFEDVDLWVRMLWDGCKCITLPDYLLYYRINESGVTRTIGKKRNILRVKYCNEQLYSKFGIKTDKNLLHYIFGCIFEGCCSPLKIDRIIKTISTQIDSTDSKKNFIEWYKSRMNIVSYQIIVNASFRYKIIAFLYLMHHITSLFNSQSTMYLKYKFTNKWIKYESCNVR